MKPNLVLIAVVLATSLFGFSAGVAWAFVAGLTANLLIPQPLGSLPLVLLVVAALVAGGGRLIGRLTWVYPVVAVFVTSVVADLFQLVLFRLVAEPVQPGWPFGLIIPAAVLNAAIAAVLVVPVRLAALRFAADERPAW